jgi:hypothetical protein
MTKKSRWVVTSAGNRPFAELRQDLEREGFHIDQALEAIGVFTGDSDDGVAQKLRKVKGVSDVSPEDRIDIGPPGSERTW